MTDYPSPRTCMVHFCSPTIPPSPSRGEGIKRHYRNAFTLAELLIALAILGVIATFTIPKVLESGSNSEWNSKAKEFAGTISGAYLNYKLNNSDIPAMTRADLMQYVNYISIDSTSLIDVPPHETGTTRPCSDAGRDCYNLHNGALVMASGNTQSMTTTDSTSGLSFMFDPDGTVSNNKDSLQIWIYSNGLIRTKETLLPNTSHSTGGPYATAADPPWFSWGN